MDIPKEAKNALHYSAEEERIIERVFEEQGYEKRTTFFGDLSIAEWYGMKNVEETVDRIRNEWFNNVEYFTEFIMCVNYKAWEHHSRGNNDLSMYYSELYHELVDNIYNSWDRGVLDYFYKLTD